MRTKNSGKSEAVALAFRALSGRFTAPFFIFLAVALILFSKFEPEALSGARMWATDRAAPVLEVFSRPFAKASDALDGVTDMRSLRAENMRLTEENQKLKRWYESALKLQAENQSLRAFLNFPKDPDLGYMTTRVIASGGGPFVKSFLVPSGSNDGVRKGQAVLSGDGMIGRIVETGKNSARVLMVTDLNSRIPVLVQNTRQKAILAGRNEDSLALERLSIDSMGAVEPGARIVTSGEGGLFPADIPLGVIVSNDDRGIRVKPLADVNALTYVQILESPQTETPDLLAQETNSKDK